MIDESDWLIYLNNKHVFVESETNSRFLYLNGTSLFTSYIVIWGLVCQETYTSVWSYCLPLTSQLWNVWVTIERHKQNIFKLRQNLFCKLILVIKPTRCTISQLYFGKEIYVFRTDLLSIIRSLNTVFTAFSICHTVC